jgi:hypothetical protein
VALLGGGIWLFIDPTVNLYAGRLLKQRGPSRALSSAEGAEAAPKS